MSLAPTPLQIDYIDPDGNDWNLSDPSMSKGYICSGINGIEGIATTLQTIPLLDGTAYANLYLPQPGTINIVILVSRPSSDDENDYYANLDAIVRAFYNRRNDLPVPGYIVIQRPDGTSRQIAVYTTSGLNTPEVAVSNDSIYSFTLQTPDPYWQDLIPQSMTFSVGAATGILPLLPVWLAGSTVLGNNTIVNQGNSRTWPVWTITGPGTPTMQNLTTGRKWSLNQTVPAGHVVQVVTQPGKQMVFDNTAGTNIWDQLVLSSLRDLWAIAAGVNQINVSMAGASLATSVSITWTNRWNRALWLYCLLAVWRVKARPVMAGACRPLFTFHLSRALRPKCGLRY